MTQITLNIPDNKIAFFMELVKNLGFVTVSNDKSPLLTDEQKLMVEAARKKAKEYPDDLVEWDAAEKQIDWMPVKLLLLDDAVNDIQNASKYYNKQQEG